MRASASKRRLARFYSKRACQVRTVGNWWRGLPGEESLDTSVEAAGTSACATPATGRSIGAGDLYSAHFEA